jgi:pimeloyl-ACP methyl ester carboxylesterase
MTSHRGVRIPAPARSAFAVAQAVSETFAARLAERWFFTPPRGRLAVEEEAFLHSGRQFTVPVNGCAVTGWEWGRGPVVYLVHGWGSRAGRFRVFAGPLVDAGYRVVTFDAPGHGESGGRLSSMPQFARALKAVAERSGPAHAVIGHSLGGSAAALAAGWGLEAKRFALLAPAADPAAFADAFASVLRARPGVMARARANSERRLQFNWTELDVCAVAHRMTAPALVVHDRGDDVVPFAEGAAIAASWPGARLLPTSDLGHRGLMRDAEVVAEVVHFVSNGRADAAPTSEAARLEHWLFCRETRWG